MRPPVVQPGFRTSYPSIGAVLLVDSGDYGALGDGSHDDTSAIQAAIDAADGSSGVSGVLLPLGRSILTDTLTLPASRGFRLYGYGKRSFADSGVFNGSELVASGMAGKPVLDLKGSNSFVLRDFSIVGNTTESATGQAKFGIRVRTSPSGTGSGSGTIENVAVRYLDQGCNCGDGGVDENASDILFQRFEANYCTVAFRTDISQALNYAFVHCGFGFCPDVVILNGGGNIAMLQPGTYDIQRLVQVLDNGDNSACVLIDGLRADGNTYRPVLYDSTSSATGGRFTFRDPHLTTGKPSGGALFKLGPNTVGRVFGGAKLCGAGPPPQPDGVLFDIDGTSLGSALLVEGTEIDASSTNVVGTIVSNGKYRVRGCVDQATGLFVTDYEN